MRKFITHEPTGTLVAILSICVAVSFIINACRKAGDRNETDAVKKFQTLPAGVHPSVQQVAGRLNRLNAQTGFLKDFIKRQGIAIWDKALVMPVQNVSTYNRYDSAGKTDRILIPLVMEGTKQVHGALTCTVTEDSVRIWLLDGSQYKLYNSDSATAGMNGQQLSLILMELDKEVFGHRLFRITDSAAFNIPGKKVPFVQLQDSSLADRFYLQAFTICFTIFIPLNNGQVVGCPPGDCPQYEEVTVCQSSGLWGGSNPGGGSWGGGDIPPSPPSGGGSYCRVPEPLEGWPGSGGCGAGGSTGWVPVPPKPQPYNPNAYDTIGYSDALKETYPCMYHLIHDSLPNVNYLAQIAGTDVFNDSAYMHLTFDTSVVYTQAGQPAGETLPFTIWVDADGITHCKALIRFNGWYLRHATKEYKLKVIIHECMHAIFKIRWSQYQQWLNPGNGSIDSFFIKKHFPIYWYYITQQNAPPSELQDHEIMTIDYNAIFSSLLKPFYNPNAPAAVRDTVLKAMGYGGLLETTAWKLLPGQGIDTCKYKAIQVCAERALIGNYSLGNCGNYQLNYTDSLHLTPGCY